MVYSVVSGGAHTGAVSRSRKSSGWKWIIRQGLCRPGYETDPQRDHGCFYSGGRSSYSDNTHLPVDGRRSLSVPGCGRGGSVLEDCRCCSRRTCGKYHTLPRSPQVAKGTSGDFLLLAALARRLLAIPAHRHTRSARSPSPGILSQITAIE